MAMGTFRDTHYDVEYHGIDKTSCPILKEAGRRHKVRVTCKDGFLRLYADVGNQNESVRKVFGMLDEIKQKAEINSRDWRVLFDPQSLRKKRDDF